MALGLLFSGLIGWMFGLSFILGLIVLIPILIVFGIVSQLVFILVILPLMTLIKISSKRPQKGLFFMIINM